MEKIKNKYKQIGNDISPDAFIFRMNSNNIVEYISPSAKNILGLYPEDIIGKSWKVLVDWENNTYEVAVSKLKELLKGKSKNSFDLSFFNYSGVLRTLHISLHGIKNRKGKISHIEGIAIDITEKQIISEQQNAINKTLETLVKQRTTDLENKNAALKTLLKKRDEEREKLEKNIFSNYESFLLPFLKRLEATLKESGQIQLMEIIEINFKEILLPFSRNLADPKKNLTATELQIANMIKHGLSTKEIAQLLDRSVQTVNIHRNNIRKKLHLVKTKTNLKAYLSKI